MKRSSQNIVRFHPGVTPGATFESAQEAFFLILTEEIVLKVLHHSNKKLRDTVEEWNRKNPCNKRKYVAHTEDELKVFLRLLFLRGLLRGQHESVQDLWKDDFCSRPLFKASRNGSAFCASMTNQTETKENYTISLPQSERCGIYSTTSCLACGSQDIMLL